MATSTQYESAVQSKDEAIPSGTAPVLYKVNPDKSITPATSGYTSSSNQLTTSGK